MHSCTQALRENETKVAPPAAQAGEEARKKWRKGRFIVKAASNFHQAGAEGAARRAVEEADATGGTPAVAVS